MKFSFCAIAFLVFAFSHGVAQSGHEPFHMLDLNPQIPEFIVTVDFDSKEVNPGSVFSGSIFITVPPGWHLYAPGVKRYKRLTAEAGEGPLVNVQFGYPPGNTIMLLGEEVLVYEEGRVEILAQGTVPAGARSASAVWRPVVSWQACTDKICLAPETRTLEIPVVIGKGP